MLLADLEMEHGTEVNVEQVLRMAVLHDLAESLTFDISKAYLQYLGERGEVIKSDLEVSAWSTIVKELENPRLAGQYARIQSEYNAKGTIDSRIVHAADGIDLLLQVLDYRRRGYPEPLLRELWSSTHSILKQARIASVSRILSELAKEYRVP